MNNLIKLLGDVDQVINQQKELKTYLLFTINVDDKIEFVYNVENKESLINAFKIMLTDIKNEE